jgi:hypothetical protein
MFLGFSKKNNFNQFPSSQFGNGSRVTAYSFPLCSFWLNANTGLNASNNLDPISVWTDQASQISFTQSTASLQPRLLKNVGAFGGNDMVEFHTSPRGLQSQVGVGFGPQKTLALVYEYSTYALGATSVQSRIIGDNDFSNSRSSGFSFLAHSVNNTGLRNQVGYGFGAGVSYGSTVPYDNLPKILVLTQGAYVVNGVNVTIDLASTPAYTGSYSWIGANNQFFVGVFKIGEVLLYDRIFSLSECVELSDKLNAKYSLY